MLIIKFGKNILKCLTIKNIRKPNNDIFSRGCHLCSLIDLPQKKKLEKISDQIRCHW